jgi:hypothetical protein
MDLREIECENITWIHIFFLFSYLRTLLVYLKHVFMTRYVSLPSTEQLDSGAGTFTEIRPAASGRYVAYCHSRSKPSL